MAISNKVCQLCGKIYTPRSKNQKYCSSDCYHKSTIGHIPWNKGLTKETSKLLEEIGRKISMKTRGKLRKIRPIKYCLNCKTQIDGMPCQIKSKKFCSKECAHQYMKGQNSPMFGKKHREESKKKMSVKKKGKSWEELYGIEKARKLKALFSERMKGPNNPMYKKSHSLCVRKFLSLNTIKQYQEGRVAKSINTSIEKIMMEALQKMNVQFVHQYNFNNKFVCDFAIPSKKIIIECDGDYWHNLDRVKKRDKAKNVYIKKCGWQILRFWEHDIKNNINKCIEKINDHLK